MESALAGIKFFCEQQKLNSQFDHNQLSKKFTRMQSQCKAKLEQVHQGYLQVRCMECCWWGSHCNSAACRILALTPYVCHVVVELARVFLELARVFEYSVGCFHAVHK
jgi:hypothetical protein